MVDVLWIWQLNAADTRTPEQKAALEERINRLLDKIEDRSVQYHYRQEFRNRLRAQWFGGARSGAGRNPPGRPGNPAHAAAGWKAGAGRGNRPGHYAGQTGRQNTGMRMPPVSGMISPNISRSHRGQAGSARNYPREASILGLVLHYPALLEDFSEELASLKLTSGPLIHLRDALLDLLSQNFMAEELDISDVRTHLSVKAETAEVLGQIDAWFRMSGQHLYQGRSFHQVRRVFAELLRRHQRMTDLLAEKEQCEQALREDYSEESLRRLIAVQAQIEADEESVRNLDFDDEAESDNNAPE